MFYEPSLSLNSIAARSIAFNDNDKTANHAHSHFITQFDFHIITDHIIIIIVVAIVLPIYEEHHHQRNRLTYMMTTTTRMIWSWALHEAKRPSTIFKPLPQLLDFFPAFALHPHLKKIYIWKLQCVSFSDAMVLMHIRE